MRSSLDDFECDDLCAVITITMALDIRKVRVDLSFYGFEVQKTNSQSNFRRNSTDMN